MSKPVVIIAKHKLGVEEAKRQITERFEALKKTVQIDRVGESRMTWIGDTAEVSAKALGQKVSADFAVAEHLVTITIRLPMLLAPFQGAIVAFLDKNADALHPASERD